MATFGNIGDDDTGNTSLYNRIKGCFDAPSEDGTMDSISVKIENADATNYAKCALYAYVDYAVNYAGAFIAETEVRTIPVGTQWVTFDFPEPKPSVTKDINYYVMVWGKKVVGTPQIRTKAGGTNCIWVYILYNSFPNPLVGDAASALYYFIYGTYTPAPETPTESCVIGREIHLGGI